MTSIRVFRWLMIALSAALALFLIARGNVVIGVLLAALAATRFALLIRMQQRRARLRERIRQRRQLRGSLLR